MSGGAGSTTTVQVRPCLPSCGITASPLPAKAGKPFTVDLSGSRVEQLLGQGRRQRRPTLRCWIRRARSSTPSRWAPPDLAATTLSSRRAGIHTLRAVVTDEAGQASTNACTAQVDVKGGFPIFVGGYFGKERLTHDDPRTTTIGRPPPLLALRPAGRLRGRRAAPDRQNAEFEAALGVKFPFDDDAHSAMFADAAANRIGELAASSGAASAGGTSGRTRPESALLLQGGHDLDKNGKWQFVGQTPPAVLQPVRQASRTTTSSGAASVSGRTAGSSPRHSRQPPAPRGGLPPSYTLPEEEVG